MEFLHALGLILSLAMMGNEGNPIVNMIGFILFVLSIRSIERSYNESHYR